MTVNGMLTTLVNFNGTNGNDPQAGLIRGQDGCFYGTTWGGGQYGDGTIFKLNTKGVLTTLYSFTGQLYDGANPSDELTQGPDGYLYGTTVDGGAYGIGVVFQVSTSGTLTTLYSFHYDYALPTTDGAQPYGGLIQYNDGYFYGTSKGGGAHGGGTFFRFPIPPTPVISAQAHHSFSFQWCSVVGGLYQLQCITNVLSTNWVDVGNSVVATNLTTATIDNSATNFHRFYRVALVNY